jgi:hypothetical protein
LDRNFYLEITMYLRTKGVGKELGPFVYSEIKTQIM